MSVCFVGLDSSLIAQVEDIQGTTAHHHHRHHDVDGGDDRDCQRLCHVNQINGTTKHTDAKATECDPETLSYVHMYKDSNQIRNLRIT